MERKSILLQLTENYYKMKEKCCMGGCGDINCEHCSMKEETIMDKSLRHHNYIAAKKKEDILANIEWSKSPPIPTPKVIESKPISWSARLRKIIKSFLM